MRVLLTYGFDPINGSVVNKSLLKQKTVKTVVRKLLHQVVKLSSVPIDPSLPPPVIKKPPPKVKQPPPPPRKRVGRDDIEMKKGDWLCSKYASSNYLLFSSFSSWPMSLSSIINTLVVMYDDAYKFYIPFATCQVKFKLFYPLCIKASLEVSTT